MAKRLPGAVVADLEAAGLTPSTAVTLAAIAGAESGWDDTNLGDLNLQDSEWGPSFGLYQIRTRRSETGTGTYRDIQWLAQSDHNQALAAVAISQGGSNFHPWTVYNTGAYRGFLGQAADAASQPATLTAAAGDGPAPTWGPDWLPWNWPSLAINAATKQALGGARSIVIEGLAVALGLTLVGVGIARAAAPTVRREVQRNKDYAAKGTSTTAGALL